MAYAVQCNFYDMTQLLLLRTNNSAQLFKTNDSKTYGKHCLFHAEKIRGAFAVHRLLTISQKQKIIAFDFV